MPANTFESCPAPTVSSSLPTKPEPTTVRRLLSIRIALQLSGQPTLTAASHILLARYVAGQLPLSDIIPLL
ncbi:hypothetical protein J0X19_03330 [Hymenobacter sp. BT186]|uniref:Uncharacterized protein n=1 Tax=Hymenobacter telluris TaxID=2816474 RepID=A0A939JC58_9BACT|nr:hypothetical protein [Hymenobacter telluris]MBO0356967.1 hypothetical protein [Hymenobacter telluris]MBW3372994.1 hypothetical protein [Hymenobacter norwichensis]